VNPDILKIALQSPNSPTKSPLPTNLNLSSTRTLSALEEYFGQSRSSWPNLLQEMDLHLDRHEVALSALGTGISFLKKCMLDDKIIKLATYIQVND